MTDTDHRPQLKAAEVSTEVQLDEDRVPGPAYVDLTSAESQRKRIIPKHWATREAAGRHVRLAAERNAHRAAYHGVRSPGYAALAAGYAVRGLFVTAIRIIEWRPDAKSLPTGVSANVSQRFCLKVMGQLENDMILGTSAYKQGRETRKARGIIIAVTAAAAALVIVAMAAYAPWWAWALLAAAVFTALARAGRPQGKTITTKAEIPAQVQPPTQDVITRALGSIGIAEINKVLRDGGTIGFPSPVREDGPGWRAEVDLPYGVTAAQVNARREQLASGLRRPRPGAARGSGNAVRRRARRGRHRAAAGRPGRRA